MMKKKNPQLGIIVTCVLSVVLLIVAIYALDTMLKEIVFRSDKEQYDRFKSKIEGLKSMQNKARKNKKIIVRPGQKAKHLIHLDPNRQFAQNFIVLENREIARFKTKDGVFSEVEGLIPDGRIPFSNETEKSYGVEYFRNGLLHGPYNEFYENGEKKREAYYYEGKKLWNKVYFIDGKLRMEENLKDALRFVDDSEVGEGKIFYRDGKLMYEWHLTNRSKGGYKRSYNKTGKLVDAKYFDEFGKLIDHKVYK